MAVAFGVLQMPMLFAAEYFGNAAGEGYWQGAKHRASNCTHARAADPAHLFIRRGAELAVVEVVETGGPLGDPATRLPLLHHLDKPAVAGGEVLRAQIQCAGIATLTGHTATAAAALVEQLYGVPGGMQRLRGRQPGDAGADDGDGVKSGHGLPRVFKR